MQQPPNSIFRYGSVELLRSNGKPKASFSLEKASLTFGRLPRNDCTIVSDICSKHHATIEVDSKSYSAELHVFSGNGVVHNGTEYGRGSLIPLQDFDEFIIAEKRFRWHSAAYEKINVDSPATTSRRASLSIAPLPATPSKAPLSTSNTLSYADLEPIPEPSLSSWEEEGGDDDGVDDGDLITWDEVEIVSEVEKTAPHTPVRATQTFTICATPSLAERARSIRPPTSVRRIIPTTPQTKGSRRTSLRMTIGPSSRSFDWAKEREMQNQARAASIAQAIPSLPSTPLPLPVTPTRVLSSTSSSRIASDHSSTSRRVSALLLSASNSFSGDLSALADGDSDSSDDDEEEEEDENGEEAVPHHLAISQALAAVQSERQTAESVATVSSKASGLESLLKAASVALPASPYGSSTATPVASPAQNSEPSNPVPRKTPSRRHSLREKVLIRSAIKKSITPPSASPERENTPQDVAAEMSPVTVAEIDSPIVEPEIAGDDIEVEVSPEVKQEIDALVLLDRIRAEDVPLPETPAFTKSPRTPLSGHRDSIDLVRSRSGSKKLFGAAETEEVKDVILHAVRIQSGPALLSNGGSARQQKTPPSAAEESVDEAGVMGSPCPAARRTPTLTPRTKVQARAASIPLPETPAAAVFDFNIITTPIAFGAAPTTPVSKSRDYFQSEMTSPVNQHRVMACPRSVLRTGPRKKDSRGFLSFAATPSSAMKRKVVFNEQVYIQEIVDIRDKRMHWNPKIDYVPTSPASTPLPESPAPSEMGTPRAFAPVATLLAASPRKAQRVPTATPASVVRKAILEAAHLSGSQSLASPRRVPIKAANISTTPRKTPSIKSLPCEAFSKNPSTPRPMFAEQGSVVETPVSRKIGMSSSVSTQSMAELLGSAMNQMHSPSTVHRSPSKTLLWNRIEAVKQQRDAPRTPIAQTPSVQKPAPSTSTKVPATPLPLLVNKTTSTPIQFAKPKPVATPNLAAGFRRMFGSKQKLPTTLATPNLKGVRNLFHLPSSTATPRMEGLKEMLKTPEALKKEVLVTQIIAESKPEQAAPLEVKAVEPVSDLVVEEAEVIEEVSEAAVAVEQLVTDRHEAQEEEAVEESAIVAKVDDSPIILDEAIIDEMLVTSINPAVLDVEDATEPHQESEILHESSERAADVETEQVLLEQEKIIIETDMEVEAPLLEEALVIDVIEVASVIVEEPEAIVEELEPIAVAPVSRKGRPTKASAVKKTPAKKVPTAKVEMDAGDNEQAEMEVIPKPKSTRGAKGKKVVEEVEEVQEEATVIPVVKRGRGKKIAVENAESEVIPEAVVSKIPTRRTARSRATEAEIEEVVAPPALIEKKKAAPRGRPKAAAPVSVHEDDVSTEIPEAPISIPIKATRGKKAEAKENVASVAALPKKAPVKRATKAAASVEKESAEIAVPAVSASGRALRARR